MTTLPAAPPAAPSVPNPTFMRYVQNPIWNFLCDHYFRLEIEGWHKVPDEPSQLPRAGVMRCGGAR